MTDRYCEYIGGHEAPLIFHLLDLFLFYIAVTLGVGELGSVARSVESSSDTHAHQFLKEELGGIGNVDL